MLFQLAFRAIRLGYVIVTLCVNCPRVRLGLNAKGPVVGLDAVRVRIGELFASPDKWTSGFVSR